MTDAIATSHSNYIGVYKCSKNRFAAKIIINTKSIHLGTFNDEFDAALAYDLYIRTSGLNRRLNVPDVDPESSIPNTRLIRLTQGYFAIVDEEDFERVNQYKWCIKKYKHTNYAVRRVVLENKSAIQKIQNFILGIDGIIDHINHNGLHNYRSNLRKCTHAQNTYNSSPIKNKSSVYKGVSITRAGTYRVNIKNNGISYGLGHFKDEIDAAKTYDSAAIKYFGEFANINFKN